MLHKLGVDMNPTDSQDWSNPKGAFEDADWILITKNIELAIKIGDEGILNRQIERAKRIIAERNEASPFAWGFKSAVTHLAIEHLMPLFSNPYLVYVFRNPLDTALSEAKFTQEPGLEYTDKLKDLKLPDCMRHTADFLYVCEKIMRQFFHVPHLYLTFEDIRKDPVKELEKVSSFVGIPATEDTLKSVNEFVMPTYCSWEVRK